MNQESSTKQLAMLIQQKHQILMRIKAMVKRQADSVENQPIADLLPLLNAKQKLIEELHRIEAKLNPYREQEPELRVWESESERQECANLVAANRYLLKEILEEEQRCEQKLKTQRAATKDALENHRTAEDAIQAYNQATEPRQSRLDLSSE